MFLQVRVCKSCESSESCPLPHLETFGLVYHHGNNTLRVFDKNLEVRRSQVYNRVFLGDIKKRYLDFHI